MVKDRKKKIKDANLFYIEEKMRKKQQGTYLSEYFGGQ